MIFFAAVALSVIDTSSSNFLAENWTRFPYLEGRAIRTSEEKNTVNSEKTISWGPKWIANLTDVIGISNRAIKDQIKRKQIQGQKITFVLSKRVFRPLECRSN